MIFKQIIFFMFLCFYKIKMRGIRIQYLSWKRLDTTTKLQDQWQANYDLVHSTEYLDCQMNPKKRKSSNHQSSNGGGFNHQSHLWASPDLNTTKSSSDHHISLRSNNLVLLRDKQQPSRDPCSSMTSSNHHIMRVRVRVGRWVNESEGEGKGEGDWVRP